MSVAGSARAGAATTSPLRILYVTRQLPPTGVGGIGSYVERLARMVHEAGHEVTVLSAGPGQRRMTEDQDGVRVERFPEAGPAWLWARLHRHARPSVSRIHGALSAWCALRRLGRTYDVIEVPEWKAEGFLLPRRRHGALVVHLHLALEVVRRWDGTNAQPRSRVGEWLERSTVRRACQVTATSELSRMLPGREQWVDGVAVTRVPPPLSSAMWTGCSPVQDTPPTVLFVGHLERRKAPEVLMAALGQLAGGVDGLRVVFVGRSFQHSSSERYDEHLQAAAVRLGVRCEIRSATAGAQQMRRLYEMARVVVVPSRFETLSLVALEAFACGRPVVMTDSVGAVEWVGPDMADLVVPTGDPSALADAMRPLLRDPERAALLGARGQRRVLEACSPTAIVDARVAVYRAAAGLPGEVPCSAS